MDGQRTSKPNNKYHGRQQRQQQLNNNDDNNIPLDKLLQSTSSVVTKCDRYYKVRQFYYKVRRLLQTTTEQVVFGLTFARYVPQASQSPYPIIVYSVANYRPHLSNFLANVMFAIPT